MTIEQFLIGVIPALMLLWTFKRAITLKGEMNDLRLKHIGYKNEIDRLSQEQKMFDEKLLERLQLAVEREVGRAVDTATDQTNFGYPRYRYLSGKIYNIIRKRMDEDAYHAVQERLSQMVQPEKFIDDVVARIERKQLK